MGDFGHFCWEKTEHAESHEPMKSPVVLLISLLWQWCSQHSPSTHWGPPVNKVLLHCACQSLACVSFKCFYTSGRALLAQKPHCSWRRLDDTSSGYLMQWLLTLRFSNFCWTNCGFYLMLWVLEFIFQSNRFDCVLKERLVILWSCNSSSPQASAHWEFTPVKHWWRMSPHTSARASVKAAF